MSNEVIPYAKDLTTNLNQRFKMVASCANEPSNQALINERCTNDIIFWTNMFVWTYNPRLEMAVTPFITYPFQDELLEKLVDKILNGGDILIDKSRDMGVSWCSLIPFTWCWLFKGEGMDFLCGSRKEQYVDKIGDMATLLQKIRFILENLPAWMRPKGFCIKDNATYMKIINPVTKSVITGEATNNNFSRGGRQRAILLDEFAFWDVDAPAWRSSADTTECRIAVSTPEGFNNHFAKLRHSGSIEVVSLHWTRHPDKAKDAYHTSTKEPVEFKDAFNLWSVHKDLVRSPWYDREISRRNNDTVAIAQELDISYEGSAEGVWFEWDVMNRAKGLDIPLSAERRVLTFDPAGEGKDEAVIYVSNNGAIAQSRFIPKCTPSELGAEIVSLAYKYKVQVIMGDAIGNDVLEMVKILLGRNETRIKLVAFKSSEKAENTAKFFNKRAEMYHNACEALKTGQIEIEDDYTLQKQLSATKYIKKNGRIIAIPKEEIKGTCGTSPDRADAWAMIPAALKLTYSVTETSYRQKYRLQTEDGLEDNYSNYGSWGDMVD